MNNVDKKENKVTKTIEVCKHPYKWNIQVEFGSLEDMLKYCKYWKRWNGIEVSIGGSFNEKMDLGRRAPLVQVAVQLDVDSYGSVDGALTINGLNSAKSIRKNPYEGTYCYYESLFDDMMKQGLFPVRADWDGKTYIQTGQYDENHRWQSWYKLTDTYRY